MAAAGSELLLDGSPCGTDGPLRLAFPSDEGWLTYNTNLTNEIFHRNVHHAPSLKGE